jgi:L-cysteine S-thiosulfotransferase
MGSAPGDATRGADILASRQRGLCLLCHQAPVGDRRFQGNIAPDLAGAGTRWTPAQLRERVADGSRMSPQSLMPRYLQTDGLHRVGPQVLGKPLLNEQEIEDVVAFLLTLSN